MLPGLQSVLFSNLHGKATWHFGSHSMTDWVNVFYESWPLALLSALLITGAVIDCWKLKVPNWLTFGMMLSGLGLAGWWHGWSGLGASLALLVFGFVLLWPVYAIGGMGAGDVKMQMGFGAWIGALYGWTEGFWIVLYGFCLAAVIGGVLAIAMMFWHGRWREYRQNTRDILSDLGQAANWQQITQRAAERKRRMVLLPYGLPLCLGFLGYLAWRGLAL
jgi:prepilin peptidase CpaA